MMNFFPFDNPQIFTSDLAVGMVAMMLFPLALLDIVLRGFGMWRAARMSKTGWFIALLVVNSLGILPAIFLLMTREEWGKKHKKKG